MAIHVFCISDKARKICSVFGLLSYKATVCFPFRKLHPQWSFARFVSEAWSFNLWIVDTLFNEWTRSRIPRTRHVYAGQIRLSKTWPRSVHRTGSSHSKSLRYWGTTNAAKQLPKVQWNNASCLFSRRTAIFESTGDHPRIFEKIAFSVSPTPERPSLMISSTMTSATVFQRMR